MEISTISTLPLERVLGNILVMNSTGSSCSKSEIRKALLAQGPRVEEEAWSRSLAPASLSDPWEGMG